MPNTSQPASFSARQRSLSKPWKSSSSRRFYSSTIPPLTRLPPAPSITLSSSLFDVCQSRAATVTESLSTREHASKTDRPPRTGYHSSLSSSGLPFPRPPELGPKLFFTFAEMREGVEGVFEYIMKGWLGRGDHEETVEARMTRFPGHEPGVEPLTADATTSSAPWFDVDTIPGH